MTKKIQDRLNRAFDLRNTPSNTRVTYLRCIEKFEQHCGKPASRLGRQHVEDFLLHLVRARQLSPGTHNVYVSALWFLFRVLGRPELVLVVPRRKQPLVQPAVLAPAQVEQVLGAVKPIAPRTILTVAYAAGLRISEACGLCFEDIDSKSMVLHVRYGKGARERSVMLSPTLLRVLRSYYRTTRPVGPQLFPGRDRRRPLTRAAVSKALKEGLDRCELNLHITPHTMRHSFATQLLEDGVDIRTVQILLGHGSICSTARYTHLTPARMGKIVSPLERLDSLTRPATPRR